VNNEKILNVKLSECSYEELVCMLQSIIDQFQKGSMKLSEAVEKYDLCNKIIEECCGRIEALKTKMKEAVPANTTEEKSIESVNFEDNMNQLETFIADLNKGVSFDKLSEIAIISTNKITECSAVLDNFETRVNIEK